MTPLHVNLNAGNQATSTVVSLDGDERTVELAGFQIHLKYEPHGYRVDDEAAHQVLSLRVLP